MNKLAAARRIARAYFFLALALSFFHLVTAGHKGGLGWEAWLVPVMVDGIAVMGLILRGAEFSTRTRKIGFRTQIGAGTLSLAGNVYAASNTGGAVLGIAVVVLFVLAEWLSDPKQITSAADEAAAIAATAAAEKQAAAVRKGQETKARRAAEAAEMLKAADKLTRQAARARR